MYKNKINKCLNNTQMVYSTINDSGSRGDKSLELGNREADIKDNVKYDKVSIDKKIDDIFNARDYVYKANVFVVTDSGTVNKTVVARNRNNLITIDNEYIPISMIRDIYK